MSDAAYERLTPDDLGLPPGARMPVRFTPARDWSPLVISFPHVGLAWPHDLHPKPQVDFPRNADYDVHTLYGTASTWGAASLAAIYSRLVADLNRAEDDVSRKIVPDHPAPRPRRNPGVAPTREEPEGDRDAGHPGRGVLWTASIGNVRLLAGPLPYAAFRDRIERFHAPYYRALQVLLERRRQRFGYAILLDAHSMPSSVGPDLVLGTLAGRSCDRGLEHAALAALTGDDELGTLQVAVNEPYRGGELVRRFGRPHDGLHALQLEVSRGLYMDEQRYRLYEPLDAVPSGTPAGSPRVTMDDLGDPSLDDPPWDDPRAHTTAQAHRAPIVPDPGRGRRLAELRLRVNSLVRCLATHGVGRSAQPTA
jgi:N-formylglutamate amidohydrolase